MRSALKYALCLTTCLIACLLPVRARAQAPSRDGKLTLTVSDPLGAVVQGATVTLTGLDDTTKNSTIAPAKTTEKGIGQFDTLLPGRYDIKAEFPGFELGVLKDVRIRSGENKHVIILPLKKVEDSVTVTRDKQDAAADRSLSFGSALTREQIDACPTIRTRCAVSLMQMAGPDAVMRIDSFEGGELPPKAQIKSIRITRDQFAAENHYAGGISIEIITQPASGRCAAACAWASRTARSTATTRSSTRGPAQNRNFGGNLGGTIKKDKASFSSCQRLEQLRNARPLHIHALRAAGGAGARRAQPAEFGGWNALVDYSVTKDQTMRFWFNHELQHNAKTSASATPTSSSAAIRPRHATGISARRMSAGRPSHVPEHALPALRQQHRTQSVARSRPSSSTTTA
jgi:hypothetical protein